ncbi:hypothetical protein, partial [Escherichia coli]
TKSVSWQHHHKAGVNGLFTDFPDKAVKFLNKE